MKLPEFSVRRPVAVSMLIGIIVVLGLFSFYHLGLEMLPDISYPVVSVLTQYPGASSEDIEESVTDVIEQVVASVSRVKSVKSISQEGLSIVMIEFTWGTNLDFAAQPFRGEFGVFPGSLKLHHFRNQLIRGEEPVTAMFSVPGRAIVIQRITRGRIE